MGSASVSDLSNGESGLRTLRKEEEGGHPFAGCKQFSCFHFLCCGLPSCFLSEELFQNTGVGIPVLDSEEKIMAFLLI